MQHYQNGQQQSGLRYGPCHTHLTVVYCGSGTTYMEFIGKEIQTSPLPRALFQFTEQSSTK